MSASCACDLEAGFDERVAARDLAAYRRDGHRGDHRRLLAALVADRVGDGAIFPRSTWWMRAAAAAFDAVRPVEGSVSGPGYVHKESEVDMAVRKEGFTPVLSETTWFWRVALYRRIAAA